MFDLEKAERECKLSKNEIEKIKKIVKREFPHDKLMYELHLIRALKFSK
jgi:hypothetical protein